AAESQSQAVGEVVPLVVGTPMDDRVRHGLHALTRNGRVIREVVLTAETAHVDQPADVNRPRPPLRPGARAASGKDCERLATGPIDASAHCPSRRGASAI